LELDIKTVALLTIQADNTRKIRGGHVTSISVKNFNFDKINLFRNSIRAENLTTFLLEGAFRGDYKRGPERSLYLLPIRSRSITDCKQ